MKGRILIAVFIIAASLLSCGKKNTEDRKVIAVSIYPIYDIMRNLALWDWDVELIIPPGSNPHTYDPLPSEVTEYNKADLFIGVDEDFDGWVTDYLSSEAIVKFLKDDTGIEDDHDEDEHEHEEAEHEHDEDAEEHHHHGNPHIWLSVSNAMKITEQMTAYLIESDPDNEAEYIKRRESYLEILTETDDDIRKMFSGLEGEAFFQWHPAWNYFAADYGLTVAGTIEEGHGQEPTLSEMKDLIRIAWSDDVKAIVVGLNVESKAAQSLAKEIGGTIVYLDSLGSPDSADRDTYVTLMKYNATQLAEALK